LPSRRIDFHITFNFSRACLLRHSYLTWHGGDVALAWTSIPSGY
jgi:hypothetical protein